MAGESAAVEKLTRLIEAPDRYNYSFSDLRRTQIEAMNDRLQQRRGQIKLIDHRATEENLQQIRDHADAAKVLLPHTAYKSYPENWLFDGKWDRMSKWLATVSTYPVPEIDPASVADVNDWLAKLEAGGHYVSCSSGTSGKSAMLVASAKDLLRVPKDNVAAFSWGAGITPAQDRKIFGVSAIAAAPRNGAVRRGMAAAYGIPGWAHLDYPVPPISVGDLMGMIMLRKAIAEGSAKPADLAEFEQVSAERARAVEAAVDLTAEALIAARGDKLHVNGLWGGHYAVAKAVRDRGFGGKDFNVENSIYVGGGLKGAQVPENYREFVYETFNIQPNRIFQNYSMQELHSAMPRCQKGGRYHVPPWVVPLVLNKTGDELLPIVQGEYEGRAAFFDLGIDGRWGGVISGDRIHIDFAPCACGAQGPSIRDDVVRYMDLEGDDKIGCAGTVDAYVRGVA